MNNHSEYLPIYQRFIRYVKAGLLALDQESRDEVIAFIEDQQQSSGGFKDRGEQEDLYYSLFGFWLAKAAGLEQQLEAFQDFILQQEEELNLVDRYSLMLLRRGLGLPDQGGLNFFRQLFRRDYPVNFSYQLFLFLLVFDARYGYRRKWYRIFQPLIGLYRVPSGAPCSLVAAWLVAATQVGLNTNRIQARLMNYWDGEHGFKAFENGTSSDLLSTGVALFALREAEADLRLLTPGSLDFIQANYKKGAFLSGDGDETRDLEYTFYGLLALGCILDSEETILN